MRKVSSKHRPWLTRLLAIAILAAACSKTPPPDLPAAATKSGWSERGIASWYGGKFHGRATASGEIFDMEKVSAAHKRLPFGTVVRVENLDNGKQLKVRINDRGPFVRGRIIDLSRAAARELGMLEAGVAKVRITVVRGAPGPTSRSSPSARDTNRGGGSGERGQLWLQVGAFRDRQRAERIASKLARDFDSVAIYSEDGWHRVQFRRLANRKEAESLARRLRRRGYASFLIEG